MGIALIVIVSFAFADTVTKLMAPHDGPTWHPGQLEPGVALLALAFAAAALVTGSVGVSCIASGAITNAAWQLFAGGNPNPLVLPREWGVQWWNVADMAVTAGVLVAGIEVATSLYRIARNPRIVRREQPS